jgi:hypothetical protein
MLREITTAVLALAMIVSVSVPASAQTPSTRSAPGRSVTSEQFQ